MYLSHRPDEHKPTIPAFASLVVRKSKKGYTMLQLFVKEAGLRINGAAVRFARLAHPFDLFLRIGLSPSFASLKYPRQ